MENNHENKLYTALMEMRIKLGLVIVAVVILLTLFVFFLYFLSLEKYKQCGIAGASDGTLFVGIVFMVYRHYFGYRKKP
ncbi:MAG: hypothetical protein ABSD71_13010 [Bacteroidales bacterium]|jgi:uncharacterized BrkB/YihY/UPF0761 family membrane protein